MQSLILLGLLSHFQRGTAAVGGRGSRMTYFCAKPLRSGQDAAQTCELAEPDGPPAYLPNLAGSGNLPNRSIAKPLAKLRKI